jgi:uncharacterized protein YbaP (TraB family)
VTAAGIVTRIIRRCAAALPGLLAGAALAQPAAAPATDCPPVAGAPSPAQIATGLQEARDHGFLWRLRKGDHVSYLYGTVHVAKLAWSFPGPTVRAALAATDAVALELDPLDPEIQRGLAQGAQAQPATALPAALRRRMDRLLDAECIPPKTLEAFSPEMQLAALTSLIGRRDGLDPGYGIDIALAGFSHAAGRQTVSLETPALQLGVLQMPSADQTIAYVDSTLDDIESGRAQPALRRIAQVWADSDLGQLEHYADWCDCLDTDTDRAEMARLLDARNPALADGIAAIHERGQRVFAAVGSLHMIGPVGLPALLARRGFVVEWVAFPR